ncbi:MAG: DUF1223 domain-containing protein [Burkholderiaceae bacterium]
MSRTLIRLGALAGFAVMAAGSNALAQGACSARSTPAITPVVELYTSEGCSSCPPADRWLSALKDGRPVVALAYHVDYWDRLGWKDRHASPTYTRRQAAQQRHNGARFSYTPQVVANGIDRPDWPSLRGAPQPAGSAPLTIALTRDGDATVATVQAGAQAPRQLSALWAVTEDGHVSQVQAGENQGARLHHDHVVRELLEVASWSPQAQPVAPLRFVPQTRPDPAHPRHVVLVVLDPATGRPLQALQLDC